MSTAKTLKNMLTFSQVQKIINKQENLPINRLRRALTSEFSIYEIRIDIVDDLKKEFVIFNSIHEIFASDHERFENRLKEF